MQKIRREDEIIVTRFVKARSKRVMRCWIRVVDWRNVPFWFPIRIVCGIGV